MSEVVATKERRQPTSGRRECRHRWVIETPHGATSRGVCKRCGAARRFPNAAEDALGESASGLGRWSGGRGVAGPAEVSLRDSADEGF